MNIYYPGRIEVTNSPQAIICFIFAKVFVAMCLVMLFRRYKLL